MAKPSSTTLNQLDLASLLNDDKVQTCHLWKDIGLQLGLAISDLERIELDNHKIDARKREMLLLWLRNGRNRTLEKLHAAIDVVQKRTREQHRTQAKIDAKTAREAIDDVKNVLDTWETKDEQLEADFNEIEFNVTKQVEWMHTVEQWEEERIEWKNGKISAQRENIIRSLDLQRHNFRNNKFVREFLLSSGVQNISLVTNQEIEVMLRTQLANIDIDRARVLGKQFTQIKKHLPQLEILQTEINDSKQVLLDRVQTYKHIIKRLEEIDISDKKLEKVQKQLDRLTMTGERCAQTKEKCYQVFEKRKGLLEDWKIDINEFNTSFEKSIIEMSMHLTQFAKFMKVVLLTTGGATAGGVVGGAAGGIVGGIISGAVTGAVTGSVVPGPGTVLGLLVGGAGGIVAGIAAGLKASQNAAAREQKVRNYQQTLSRARTEHQKLKDLLST